MASSFSDIAKGVQSESSWAPESVDLSLGHNGPGLTIADQADHFEDTGIIPDVTNAGNAILSKGRADNLFKFKNVNKRSCE